MNLAEALTTMQAHGAFGRGVPLVPGTNIALLTKPSKMPGYSWSLPAGNARNGQSLGTCPGAVFGEGSICGSCYANPDSLARRANGAMERRGGTYGYPVVREAQAARHAWTFDCLVSKEGRDLWVAVMTAAVVWSTRVAKGSAQGGSRRIPYFRVHDSGDMFSPRYAQMWQDVCAGVPDVRFWIPTRSWHSTPRILTVLQDVAALPNVAVRPSALRLEETAPVVPGLSAGTGARSVDWNCPASSQGNKCLDCRTCFRKDVQVYYHVH